MTNRRIFIGDVHGHYDALMSLLEAIDPATSDEIYFLGDLIDRGPQSAQVVNFAIANNYQCLLGNHEEMLLEIVDKGDKVPVERFQAWIYSGGYATITSYGNNIPQDHVEWMKKLPKYLDLGDIWLVHAGVDPRIPFEKQTSDQFCWIRDEFHSMSEPYFPDKLIIAGHTITFTLPGVKPGNLASGEGWIDIETGAYHPNSGWLTALDMTNEKVYQVNAQEPNLRILPLKKVLTKIQPSSIASKRDRKVPF
ncbi:MAG: metallophosphoesterase family protein [Prochloraceae cyanobacterium]|nr:metallophosphoesterase family protein [Prochloraceae cyanobacterium]